MPPSTTSQRAAIAQFVGATNASVDVAKRYLKNANYNVEVAANTYFTQLGVGSADDEKEAALEKMFRSFRGSSEPIEDDLFPKYLSKLGVDLSDSVDPTAVRLFVVLDTVQAETFGSISKKGFVQGWKASGAGASDRAHKAHIDACMKRLGSDPAYFKRVYRSAFQAGKEASEKALKLENALTYWEMFFGPNGNRPWWVGGRDFFRLWVGFLEDKWKRTVNRDMWNQTLEFARKTEEDPTLGFWSAEQFWPSVIDDFVQWCRDRHVVPSAGGEAPAADGAGMDIDY